MKECLSRLEHPKMQYYHKIYENSKRFESLSDLNEKTVILYCEQGYGDIIQFSRYIPLIKEHCKKLFIYCPIALHRLFEYFECELIDKDEEVLPEHDGHVLSFSLPFLLNIRDVDTPYIKVNENEDLLAFKNKFKIGIAWEGSVYNFHSSVKSCPLKHFKSLIKDNVSFFMLQKQIYDDRLLEDAADFELNGVKINDFYDTAKLINSLDLVVSIDTAILHLAGAMGKKTIGILSKECDSRWLVDTWYSNMFLVRQSKLNDWETVFSDVKKLIPMIMG